MQSKCYYCKEIKLSGAYSCLFWIICHRIACNFSHCRGAEVILLTIWNFPIILRTQPSPDHGLLGSAWSDSAPPYTPSPTLLSSSASWHSQGSRSILASQPLPDTIVTQTFTWVHPTLYFWLGSNIMCSVTSSFSWKYLRPQPRYLSSFLLTVAWNYIVLSFYSYFISPTGMQFSCVQRVCIIHNWNLWCPQRYQKVPYKYVLINE